MGRPRNQRASERDLWGETLALLRAAPGEDLTAWRAQPVEFCQQVLGVTLWSKQQEALTRLLTQERLSIRSSHGVGKTFLAACAALWWTYAHKPSLVLTTAPTTRQVEGILWPEMGRLWVQARTPLPGRCLMTRLDASHDQHALGLSTNEPERFAGWHCENLLVIVDEASGVPDCLFEVLHGTLTSAHCRLLLIGNPTKSDGYFAQTHRKWQTNEKLHLSSLDTPNWSAPEGEVPCPWLVTRSWVEARRQEWGEASDAWRVRVLGEFPKESTDALFPLAWVERAWLNHTETNPKPYQTGERTIGLDVARYGSCQTVAAFREGDHLARLEAWAGSDLMQTAGRALALAREWHAARLVIDETGIGSGVVDRLREIVHEDPTLHALSIGGFVSAARPQEPAKFRDRRAEAYWALRERYQHGEITQAQEWSALTGQLTDLRYGFTSKGQIAVESKDEMRKRGRPSPDWADAVMLAFAPEPGGFDLPVTESFERSRGF